jgi:dTDP-4-dehydrorhamnose 3,5-epimerase
MNSIQTAIPGVLILEPKIHGDSRGFFFESYNRRTFESIGITADFVQDNQSSSQKNVVRALHYQVRQPQAKLVRVILGRIFDVAVDVRRSSASFGKWVGVELSADNHRMLWIPRGFAHGFAVLSETAEVAYKADAFYAPEFERCIIWDDPAISIDWHLDGDAVLSAKDLAGRLLKDAEVFE